MYAPPVSVTPLTTWQHGNRITPDSGQVAIPDLRPLMVLVKVVGIHAPLLTMAVPGVVVNTDPTSTMDFLVFGLAISGFFWWPHRGHWRRSRWTRVG